MKEVFISFVGGFTIISLSIYSLLCNNYFLHNREHKDKLFHKIDTMEKLIIKPIYDIKKIYNIKIFIGLVGIISSSSIMYICYQIHKQYLMNNINHKEILDKLDKLDKKIDK